MSKLVEAAEDEERKKGLTSRDIIVYIPSGRVEPCNEPIRATDSPHNRYKSTPLTPLTPDQGQRGRGVNAISEACNQFAARRKCQTTTKVKAESITI